MVVAVAHPVQARGLRESVRGREEVLPVAAAAAVGAEGAGHVDERRPDSVPRHPRHGVRQHRMPVPVAQVDREPRTALGERRLERPHELAGVLRDGAHPAEPVVTLRDAGLAGGRDRQPAEDVVEERHDVVRSLRAAERDDQDGVVAAGLVVEELGRDHGVSSLRRNPGERPGAPGAPVSRPASPAQRAKLPTSRRRMAPSPNAMAQRQLCARTPLRRLRFRSPRSARIAWGVSRPAAAMPV